ncbi:MAG: hypothetical protein QOD99_982 [Chthoniobacter sp.]|jgi:cell shape-determining protein MreD|nr:hypothetical protein [Chthoniobacter sp.]
MIMFPVFLLAALFFALVGEHFIPPLPWLHEARVLLMPVVFFYAALAVPAWATMALAFLAGLMWDALAVQVLDTNVEISLGWSILLYASLGAIMSGFRPLYQRGHGWEIHCLMCGPLVSLMVLAEFLMITVRRGEFLFPQVVWWRIGGAGLVAMMLAPFVFLILHLIAVTFGWAAPQRRKVAQ